MAVWSDWQYELGKSVYIFVVIGISVPIRDMWNWHLELAANFLLSQVSFSFLYHINTGIGNYF